MADAVTKTKAVKKSAVAAKRTPSSTAKGAKHWRSVRDKDGIETLILDRADGPNALNEEVLSEFEAIVAALEKDTPKGVIVASGKDNHFIYGADARGFVGVSDEDEIVKLVERVHEMFNRFEKLSCPTVAKVHGPCLGGGLELALACRYRVAETGASFGFPEVMLGIHPGFGGTVRSIHHLPATTAMDLMLTGRTVRAKQAKKIGLVHDVQPARHLDDAARGAIKKGYSRPNSTAKIAFFNAPPVRQLLARYMEKQAAKRARKEHYPAPYALIDLWREHGGDTESMLHAEARSLARLITGDTAQNLVRAFFLRERLKTEGGKADAGIGHVHVVGAGVMGGDIAAWCAMQGLKVTLSDLDEKQIARAIGRANDLFRGKLKESAKVRDAHDRLTGDADSDGLKSADLIIEAVAERLDVKKKVFAMIEGAAKEGALLATNTSSILLEDIAPALKNPGRLLGLHFFNPVAKLPLVEIVAAEKTDAKIAARGAAFADAIGKLPLPVKSAPGFLVNRTLTPYMLEAIMLLEKGVAPETIDKAAERFGMPVGPVELADTVGLDICLEVGKQLGEGSDLAAPDRLVKLVEAGKLGKKTGEGFYAWKDGEAQKGAAGEVPAEMTDRLILPMVNACATCIRTGVVEDEELADAGMIFGTGFAPFRGGPMRYAEARGRAQILAALQALQKSHGDRFAPDPYWTKDKAATAAEKEKAPTA